MKSADESNLENGSASGDVHGHGAASEAPVAGPAEPEIAPAALSEASPFAEGASGPAVPGESPKAAEPPLFQTATTSPSEATGHQAEASGRGAAPVAIEASAVAAETRLGDALAALDRRDYATAKRLFEAIGRKDAAEAIEKALAALDRKDYATAQGLFEALALPKGLTPHVASPAFAAEPSPALAIPEKVGGKPVPPLPVAPFVEPEHRGSAPRPGKGKRRSRLLALAACLALLAIFGAAWAARQNVSFTAAKSEGFAAFASAFGLLKQPLAATAEPSGKEDVIGDLRARVEQANDRLDRIERESGARLDKLSERMDAASAPKSAEPAPPTTPTADMTDVVARLDRLEKSVIGAPAPDLADVSQRLDKLDKKVAADAAAGAKLADVTARLEKLEKRVSAQTANATAPPQPSRAGNAQSSAPNEAPVSRRLLQNYAVEDVEGGVAVVASRYGSQQVAPGDFLPGAGRVLRIEKHGGDWYVVTSSGVIAGQAPY
jgi:hypothetical protein